MPDLNRRHLLAGGAAAWLCAGSATAQEDPDEAARAFAARHSFNGVMLAGTAGRVTYQQAFGLADFASRTPMTTDTVFHGGSVSKWIAALVVLRLVDQRRLALRTPIASYLPDYRRDTARLLTLEHLMSHASGLPNEVIPALEANLDLYKDGIDTAEAVRRYASGDLQFAPGRQWQYSHSNWLVVQQIVERVTGQAYAQAARELLFAPAGLRHSGVFSGLVPPAQRVATSYRENDPGSAPVVIGIPAFMQMIGGYWTDAADLFALLRAARRGPLLSAASRAELFRVRFPERRYALGGRVMHARLGGAERAVMEETGASLGFRALGYGPLDGDDAVVMLNNVSLDADDMEPAALRMLDGLAGRRQARPLSDSGPACVPTRLRRGAA